MFYLCHSKPRGSSFPFRTPLFRTHYLIKREVQWPCMSYERVDSLISLQLQGSPSTNAPSDTQWHTVTHSDTLAQVCECCWSGVLLQGEGGNTLFKKIQNWRSQGEMTIFRCWSKQLWRLWPQANASLQSYLAFDPQAQVPNKDIGTHMRPTFLKHWMSVHLVQDQHVQDVKAKVSFSHFSPAPRCARNVAIYDWDILRHLDYLDLDHFLRSFFLEQLEKKHQNDVWTLLNFASSSCTGPWWAQHLCEAGYRAPETDLFH